LLEKETTRLSLRKPLSVDQHVVTQLDNALIAVRNIKVQGIHGVLDGAQQYVRSPVRRPFSRFFILAL